MYRKAKQAVDEGKDVKLGQSTSATYADTR